MSCLSDCIRVIQTLFYEPRLVTYLCLYLKLFSSYAAVFIPESLPVVGFIPHVDTTGVFGIARDHTCPNVLVLKGRVSAANQTIGLFDFIALT